MSERPPKLLVPCFECGANKYEGAECWLCASREVNPFKSPGELDESAAGVAAPFGVWKVLDYVASFVLIGYAILSMLGIFVGGGDPILMIAYGVCMLPGVLVAMSIYQRGRLRGRKGFGGSLTFALLSGWFVAFGVGLLLIVAFLVFLFIVCMNQGPMF